MAVQLKDLRNIAVDFPQKELTELGVFAVKATSSDLTYAAATTGVMAFELPTGRRFGEGFLVLGFGYRCTTAWSHNPIVQIGPSTDPDKFGTLTGAQLMEANRSGMLWCFEEMVSSDYSSTGFNVTVTFDHGDASATTGAMDLWMVFKPGLAQSYLVRN